MDDIFQKATQIVMQQLYKELNAIVEEGTKIPKSLEDLKKDNNIFGLLVADIVENKVEAINRHKTSEYFNPDNILITKINKIRYASENISGDVILNVSGRDEPTNKSLMTWFYGGEDKGKIYHPNMRIDGNIEARDIEILESIQEKLTEKINDRIKNMVIEVSK